MDRFFEGCERRPGSFASAGFTLELLWKYGVRAAKAGPLAGGGTRTSMREMMLFILFVLKCPGMLWQMLISTMRLQLFLSFTGVAKNPDYSH